MPLTSIAPSPPTKCAVCGGPKPLYDRFRRGWFFTTLVKVCAQCAAHERLAHNHVIPAEQAITGVYTS